MPARSKPPTARGKGGRPRSRARARGADRHRATLGAGHVALVPPASGQPITSRAIAVVLEKLVVRRILAREGATGAKRAEGLLLLDVNGQHSSVAWEGPRQAAFERDGDRRLLFAGAPTRPLEIRAELVESDRQEAKLLERLERAFEILAAAARTVPVYGSAAAAGAGLGSALVELLRSRVDEDIELRFLGSIGEPGASDPAPHPEPMPLLASPEPYRLLRRADDPAREPEIEIHFSIHALEASKLDPQQAILVLLERVELNLVGIRPQDTLHIDASFVGGREPRSRSRKAMHFALEQELHDSGVWLERTLGLRNKLLYRGPWGGGLSFSLCVAVRPSQLDPGLARLIETAGAFAGTLAEDDKQEVASLTKAAETLRATALQWLPDKRFAISQSSAITLGSGRGRQPSGLYALPDLDTWQRLAVELKHPKHGRATFHLWLRKAD